MRRLQTLARGGRPFESLTEAAKYAIAKGDKALFDTLLEAGLQINKPVDAARKEYVLHEAVRRGKLDMLRYLLEQGANPLLRDYSRRRPIDDLEFEREADIVPLITALARQPTDYDESRLMQIPVPVWHEILGAPEPAPDPLAPPAEHKDAISLIPFVSINENDPPPEMTPALNAHFPGWRPRSRGEETKDTEDDHGYRDTQTRDPGKVVEITLVKSSSKQARRIDRDALGEYALAAGGLASAPACHIVEVSPGMAGRAGAHPSRWCEAASIRGRSARTPISARVIAIAGGLSHSRPRNRQSTINLRHELVLM